MFYCLHIAIFCLHSKVRFCGSAVQTWRRTETCKTNQVKRYTLVRNRTFPSPSWMRDLLVLHLFTWSRCTWTSLVHPMTLLGRTKHETKETKLSGTAPPTQRSSRLYSGRWGLHFPNFRTAQTGASLALRCQVRWDEGFNRDIQWT